MYAALSVEEVIAYVTKASTERRDHRIDSAAISDVGPDPGDHHLDCEHYFYVRRMAVAHNWAAVGVASWLGNGNRIRMRSIGQCNGYIAPAHAA